MGDMTMKALCSKTIFAFVPGSPVPDWHWTWASPRWFSLFEGLDTRGDRCNHLSHPDKCHHVKRGNQQSQGFDRVSPTVMRPKESSVSSVGDPSWKNLVLRKPVLGWATIATSAVPPAELAMVSTRRVRAYLFLRAELLRLFLWSVAVVIMKTHWQSQRSGGSQRALVTRASLDLPRPNRWFWHWRPIVRIGNLGVCAGVHLRQSFPIPRHCWCIGRDPGIWPRPPSDTWWGSL